ncbi:MAG: NADH-quinone oxidoreductase subunit NuoF [Chlamydiae bacterium]|nr:NADH-quinone oxidoreductase subunit NuoF [Chlamydiota bacterium]
MAILQDFKKLKEKAKKVVAEKNREGVIQIQVGSATCENAAGSLHVFDEFVKHIKTSQRKDILIRRVGCTGRCSFEPIVSILFPGKDLVVYKSVDIAGVHDIFLTHVMQGKPVQKYLVMNSDTIKKKKKKNVAQKKIATFPITSHFLKLYGKVPFYNVQSRIALRNAGLIDPLNIYEYINYQGFEALATVLEKNDPEWVIKEMTDSKLRGRGGAGFPTGLKWSFARKSEEKTRYMICNADEGDPGAFMDRSMLESDPFSIIEGMIIAGFAIGASKGFFYIRAEYPLAVERIEKAIVMARAHNLLGKNILGSNFDYDLEIKLGAGAFVCGEETALIHSIEGKRGQPRIRPPFPAEEGLWKKPTIINNVETLANVPAVIAIGGKEFAKIGTEKSGGTKVFAVSGKVNHTGLVEVPIGTPLKEVVYDICGGLPNNKKLKAVQTGGPAGGCIPASLLDTKADYEDILRVGSIMGSGGFIILDEDDCMVDVAKFFMTFSCDESCGKCTPCREGTVRVLEILTRITEGKGQMEDLDKLQRLGKLLQKASLCGLGRACCNPILSTLKYFRDEYESHILKKSCPAKRCAALIRYEVDPEKCVGCTMCARNCPVSCITGERRGVHFIHQDACIKCGKCFEVCRFGAIKRL